MHPFKQYSGSKARYETENDIEELSVFTRHISDYIENAESNGFEILEIKEWFTLILIEFDENGEATIVWAGNHHDYELTFINNRSVIKKWLRDNSWI